jgi:4-hydroxymandelate oxidase
MKNHVDGRAVVKHEPINVADYERLACELLDKSAYDYFAGFAGDGVSLRQNVDSYKRIGLRPRMLRDVSERKKTVQLFGQTAQLPLIVAPTAFHALAHKDGEIATARAAESLGIPMCLSTLANNTMEDVTASTTANIWFQLYVYRDKGVTKSLVERAGKTGCKALVVTVDSPLLGRRENDVRNNFSLPAHLTIANLEESSLDQLPRQSSDSGLAAYIEELYDTSLTWKDIEWLKSLTNLPLVVKGILRADDAVSAIKSGASGIVVSNHGGRQLDTTIAPILALPEVVEAAGDAATILIDGGVRRGTDVLKALALGASAVLIGRPIIWGLAVNGWLGAKSVLEILRDELDLAMALAGCPDLASITRDLIVLPQEK